MSPVRGRANERPNLRAKSSIRVGIGGWTYAPWRGRFYPSELPQARELEYAARNLTTIEINGTFYGPQKPATFAKWRDATPENFVFAVKAPRYATHRRTLADAGPTIDRFVRGGLLELGDKLGPINWQLMPTTRFDPADMAAFLKLLPRKVGRRELRHAIEVRHDSFRTEEFIDLARRQEVAVVLAGDSIHPQIPDVTAGFVYIRIMGTTAGPAKGYPPAALTRWARRVRCFAEGDVPTGLKCVSEHRPTHAIRDVFLYVIGGHKQANPAAAQALLQRLD
jgi:uncharacterized protein YecE (DUF72 family)